jgi:hypothetical protein
VGVKAWLKADVFGKSPTMALQVYQLISGRQQSMKLLGEK